MLTFTQENTTGDTTYLIVRLETTGDVIGTIKPNKNQLHYFYPHSHAGGLFGCLLHRIAEELDRLNYPPKESFDNLQKYFQKGSASV